MTPARIGSRPEVGSSKKMTSARWRWRGRDRRAWPCPRELGGVEIGGLRSEAHPRELVERQRPRLAPRHRHPRLAQAKGDVLPDGEAVEERPALEQHAEMTQECPPVDALDRHPVDQDRGRVRSEDAEDALQRHRLAGARPADDHQALPRHHLQRDAVEHPLSPNAFFSPRSSIFGVAVKRTPRSEIVRRQDQHRGRDHGVRGGLADPARAAPGVVGSGSRPPPGPRAPDRGTAPSGRRRPGTRPRARTGRRGKPAGAAARTGAAAVVSPVVATHVSLCPRATWHARDRVRKPVALAPGASA